MANHPYFRFFPADAEGDEFYRRLNLEERGLFHSCLNFSWLNHGLPLDLEGLAHDFRVPWKQFQRAWKKVSEGWKENGGRLFNPRQEKERVYVRTKSERAATSVRSRYERSKNVVPPASDSDYDYDSGNSEQQKNLRAVSERKLAAADLNGATSQRFEDWWAIWSTARGTFKKHSACQAYISVVTTALEAACFDCTRSYLASLKDRSNGYNPDNFLFEQAKDDFAGRWIPRKKTMAEVMADEEAEAERIDQERVNGRD